MDKDKKAPNERPTTDVDSKNYEDKSVMWSTRYQTAASYQKTLFYKWSKWYDDMYAHVHNQSMAPWRSKVYMPVISSKVWDLISRFIQYRPGWDVSVREVPKDIDDIEKFEKYVEDVQKKAGKVKAKLEFDYDNPLRDEPIQDELLSIMLDAAVTGQGIARVPYCNPLKEYKEHTKQGDSVNLRMEKVTKKYEGHNGFDAVNVFNFFLAPGARNLQKSPWIIIHDFVPLYELQNSTTKYQNLDKVKTTGLSNEFASLQASRNRFVGSEDTTVLDATVQMAEIYECWDKATNSFRIYAVGNGNDRSAWVEILPEQTNMYWHGKYPFVAFYVRQKPYQFWGESIFENSETLQSAINDIFNHFMDGHNMADGMIAIEEGSVVEPYVIQPGGEIRYRGEMPKQFKYPSPDATGMQTAMNLINGSIENATLSQYASGIPDSSNDNTQGTATGVTRIMEAAAEKVGFMRSNFRRSWREVGNMWLSNTQQFMNESLIVEKEVRGKKLPQIIKPADMLGIYDVKIDDGSFEPVSKDQQRQDYLAWVANLSDWQAKSLEQRQVSGDPKDALRLDWNEIAVEGARLYGQNYAHFLLPTKEAPAEPAAPAQPETPALPAEAPPLQIPPAMQAPIDPSQLLAEGDNIPITMNPLARSIT